MNEVAGWLLARIQMALPEPLREIGWYRNDPARDEAVRSAADKLSTVEQIQELIAQVFEEQLQRLNERWSAAAPASTGQTRQGTTKKRKARRVPDKQRIMRDRMIADIDSVARTIIEFLQIMDEREVLPQPTWSGWPGSWKEAYKIPRLRALIHKDKSRAIARAARRK
jgi:hypothetical protein